MTRNEIIEKVKVDMDEYTPENVSVPYEDLISPAMDESARDILLASPLHLLVASTIPLSGGTPVVSRIAYSNDKAFITVPSDFLRLYEIRFPLWKRAVRKALTPEDDQYKIQENEYIKSGYGRPTVTVVRTSINGGSVDKYFECAKVLSGAVPSVATYVKTDLPENLPDIFKDAISWLTASKLFKILEYAENSKACMEQFANSMALIVK